MAAIVSSIDCSTSGSDLLGIISTIESTSGFIASKAARAASCLEKKGDVNHPGVNPARDQERRDDAVFLKGDPRPQAMLIISNDRSAVGTRRHRAGHFHWCRGSAIVAGSPVEGGHSGDRPAGRLREQAQERGIVQLCLAKVNSARNVY